MLQLRSFSFRAIILLVLLSCLTSCDGMRGNVSRSCLEPYSLGTAFTKRNGSIGMLLYVQNCNKEPVPSITSQEFQFQAGTALNKPLNVTLLPNAKHTIVYLTLLLDVRKKTLSYRSELLKAVEIFVQRMVVEKKLPIRVGIELFTGKKETIEWLRWSNRVEQIKDWLNKLQTYSGDTTQVPHLFDAVQLVMQKTETWAKSAQRRSFGSSFGQGMVLLVSDGVDGKKPGTYFQHTDVEQLIRVPLFAVGLRSKLGISQDALYKMAASGTFLAEKPSDLYKSFLQVGFPLQKRLNATYVLGFSSNQTNINKVQLRILGATEIKNVVEVTIPSDLPVSKTETINFTTACEGRECGGVGCGTCDESSSYCDNYEARCLYFCALANKCNGEQLTNPNGYKETCSENPSILRCTYDGDSSCVTKSEKVKSCDDCDTVCGGLCVDFSIHRNHCGKCNNPCPAGYVCKAGVCELNCLNNLTYCVGQSICIDLQTNEQHCGACNNACVGRESCRSGVCVCPDGWMACNGAGASRICVDAQTSRQNCGACNKTCLEGQVCQSGVCRCSKGWELCKEPGKSSLCVFTQTNNKHCGRCNQACQNGNVCQSGVCQCPKNWPVCKEPGKSSGCVDIQTNKQHCGACNKTCPDNHVCFDGACSACPKGEIMCNGSCVNTQTDRSNCGGCGKICISDQKCQFGVCVCPPRHKLCGQSCVEVGFVDSDCYDCGYNCFGSMRCSNYRCWCRGFEKFCWYGCEFDTSCRTCCAKGRYCQNERCVCWPYLPTECNGDCVDLETDGKNCGKCGNVCKGGKVCKSKVCKCPPNFVDCNGTCVDINKNCGRCGNVCKGETTCISNVCSCPKGYTNCNGKCVVTDANDLHCGSCSRVCQAGTYCIGGVCSTAPAVSAIVTSAMAYHTCAILNHGKVKCWGYNKYGQLGYGDTSARNKPGTQHIELGASRKAKQLTMGRNHTCALLDNNTVKCWGDNKDGQLGYGDTLQRNKPVTTSVPLGQGRSAIQIKAGYKHTCALLDNNSVKCWGTGMLGYGKAETRSKPHSFAIDLGPGRTATQIATGYYHSCALLDNHTVKCWGSNESGQLGYGDVTSRGYPDTTSISFGTGMFAVKIEAGSFHTCSLRNDKRSTCWGSAYSGVLGLGYRPTVMNPGESYGPLKGQSAPKVAINLGKGRTVQQISCGSYHTCALLDDNTLKCWGDNTHGQLGGKASKSTPHNSLVSLGAGRSVKQVVAGAYHTCVLLDNNTIKCWGANLSGQLGYGDLKQRDIPPLIPINL